MAVRKPPSFLSFAFATLFVLVASTSTARALAHPRSNGAIHWRRVLLQSSQSLEPGPTHTFFSKVAAAQTGLDYEPPHSNPSPVYSPIPSSSDDSFHQFDSRSEAGFRTDYAPVTTHPPDIPDYPPGEFIPPAEFHTDYAPARTHPPDIPDYPPGEDIPPAEFHTDYPPATTHPPDIPDYPPGEDIPPAEFHTDYPPATTHPPDIPDYPPGEFIPLAEFHTDYAPATTHPPDIPDYPPGEDIPAETWSSVAGKLHATVPPPENVYSTQNFSNGDQR